MYFIKGSEHSCGRRQRHIGIDLWHTKKNVGSAQIGDCAERLPTVGVSGSVDAFASDGGMETYGVSCMFDRYNRDADKVDMALVLLAKRSCEHPMVLHYGCLRATNVEAFVMADVFLSIATNAPVSLMPCVSERICSMRSSFATERPCAFTTFGTQQW